MEISIKFDNAKDFFTQLPALAAAIGFSGQFVTFGEKPKGGGEPVLETPNLPKVERIDGGVRVYATATQSAEEAGRKIEAAYDAAGQPQKPQNAPETASKTGTTEKSQKPKDAESAPAEAAQDAPQAKSDKPLTDADVRTALVKLKAAQGAKAVRALFAEFGVKNATEITAENYTAVLAKVKEALG